MLRFRMHSPLPWMIVEQGEDDIIVASNGQYICTPHGETLGELIDNAILIINAVNRASEISHQKSAEKG